MFRLSDPKPHPYLSQEKSVSLSLCEMYKLQLIGWVPPIYLDQRVVDCSRKWSHTWSRCFALKFSSQPPCVPPQLGGRHINNLPLRQLPPFLQIFANFHDWSLLFEKYFAWSFSLWCLKSILADLLNLSSADFVSRPSWAENTASIDDDPFGTGMRKGFGNLGCIPIYMESIPNSSQKEV